MAFGRRAYIKSLEGGDGQLSIGCRNTCMKRFRSLRYLGAIGASALLSTACEPSRSRFAAESQANHIAETTDYEGGRTKPDYEGRLSPEGIAHAHGHYYYVRNGQGTLLTSRQRFVEGATFDKGGRIMLADGSLVRLADGDMVTFGGDRMPMPPGTRLP